MRGFWRLPKGLALMLVAAFLNAPALFAKFEETTSPKVDTTVFGGLSDEEFDKLAAEVTNDYITSIGANLKKFNEGDKSTTQGGSGRYSGYGEAHVSKGDAMVSHEGGSNAAERAIEIGVFGTNTLTGDARTKAEKEIMEKNTVPIKEKRGDVEIITGWRNNLTGQVQKRSFEISGALYDAGPAHGDDNDSHRVYAVKPEVRTESEKNGAEYANKTIQDATRAPDKQPNLDLLHKAFSKMEQDKYIMMASDAFAFKSARLDATDTTDAKTKNTIAEYKQIATNVYADKRFAGNIKEAEKEIQTQLAKRVAEKKVINDKKLCWDGSVGKCPDKPSQSTAATKPEISIDDAAARVLSKLNASTDGVNIQAIKGELESVFSDGKGGFEKKPVGVEELMERISLRSLAGVLDAQQLSQKYEQAKQTLEPEEQTKLAQYQQRLTANECLNFRNYCYVGKFAPPDPNAQNKQAAPGATGIDKDDPMEFQKLTGDPGEHFRDTREFIFNKFAVAYNSPLAEWKNIVTSLDFNQGTDTNIKDKGLYAEFTDMHNKAMAAAKQIQENADRNLIIRLQSAGATPEQLAKIQKNYSVKFDPKRRTQMELFGQNKDRDAIMMDWRKPGSNRFNPYAQQRPTAPPAQKSPLSNVRSNGVPGIAGPN